MTPNIAPDGTITFKLTLPWGKLHQAYLDALKHHSATVEIKGFRTGKAPTSAVEATVGKDKLYQDAFAKSFFASYNQIVKDHHLSPIIAPQVKPLTSQEGQDWDIQVTTAQAPVIDLKGYQTEVKGALAKDKLWVPGKTDPKAKDQPASQDQKLALIFDALLKHIQFSVSPILIDQETNQALTKLLDQVNHLGLTIDQYLTSKNITQPQLKAEYALTALTNLKLEFILQAIAQDLKIEPNTEEIDALIAKAPENQRSQLKTPSQIAYLKAILTKRKTIDALLAL